jgi:hypothetical protein
MDARSTLTAMLTAVLCAACSGGAGDTPNPVQPITYRAVEFTTPDTVLTAVADSVRLSAIAIDAAGARTSVSTLVWTSSDAQTVSVSSGGVATARRAGVAIIIAALGSLRDSMTVTVQQTPVSILVETDATAPLIRAIGASVQARAAVRDRNGNVMTEPVIAWSVGDTTIATIDARGALITRKTGKTDVIARTGTLSATWPFEVATRVRVPVDSYLATPITGATWEVPVVIVSFLPTADGKEVDVRKSPDFYTLNPLSLPVLENNILDIVRRKKMALEQGSRFRGYANPSALPSVGIRVVEHINVYELPPASSRPGAVANTRLPDWFKVFADLRLDSLITNRGVKQVWVVASSFDASFPSYDPSIHSLADARYMWESNMSSPTTGDVSNSDRFAGDLPVLGHTYVMYGINFRRSQAEAIHNVGHQLEATLAFVNQRTEGNTNLFWRSFVGQNTANAFITGRAGWTHMPPNTIGNYDYLNATSVSSDIEDWRPDGTGAKKLVNVDTWGRLMYPWPGAAEFGQRVEAQWYVYWMQNMPGLGNTIPRGTGVMTNWWWFFGDWDAAVRAGPGLATGG